MRPRRVIVSLAGLATAGLLALLVSEVLVRLVAPQPLLVIQPGLYEAGESGGYRLSPGYRGRIGNRVEYEHDVIVDARGLRVTGVEGAGSLLAIGDSFTFGMGVEGDEVFVAEAARRLGTSGLNGGLPGTGVPDIVDWYERHGRALAADTVVLAIFLGNDLADARPDREPIRIVDGLIEPLQTPSGIRSWLYRHLDLARLIKSASGSSVLAGLRQRAGLGEPWQTSRLRYELSTFAIDPGPFVGAAIETTDEALLRLDAMCAEDRARLTALLIPDRVQLSDVAWRQALEQLGLDAADYAPDAPTRLLADLLERHGIPFLDLSPALRRALSEDRRLYFSRDRHWTPAAHALAGAELAEFLAARGSAEPERS